ncbi:hypothetical protein EBS02_03775 [bacterium]|nr:hypothetical protein [bacterium]
MKSKDFLKDKLSHLGRELPEYQVEKIVSYIGNDELLLSKAADKIDILLDVDDKINIRDLEQLFVKRSFDSYLKIVKYIGSENLKACLEEFNSVNETGFLLGFISYYFKWLEKAFVFLIKKSKNVDDHVIRESMGISHFEFSNLEKFVSGYSLKRIVKILNGLCELDIEIKEKGLASREAVHNFLIAACVGC